MLRNLWRLIRRKPGPVGYCRYCRQLIYEPFSMHADRCEAYAAIVARDARVAHSLRKETP